MSPDPRAGRVPWAVWLVVALGVLAVIAWLAVEAAEEANPFLYDS